MIQKIKLALISLALLSLMAFPGVAKAETPSPKPSHIGVHLKKHPHQNKKIHKSDISKPFKHKIIGIASYYGAGDGYNYRRTANGQILDTYSSHTCAVRYAKFGTIIHIVNLSNGKRSYCRVNDRGPFVSGRIIDVTWLVKKELGMPGLARVELNWS
jgi:rare lipoprotein A